MVLTKLRSQRVDLAIAAKPDDLSSSIHFPEYSDLCALGIATPRDKRCGEKVALQADSVEWANVPIILTRAWGRQKATD